MLYLAILELLELLGECCFRIIQGFFTVNIKGLIQFLLKLLLQNVYKDNFSLQKMSCIASDTYIHTYKIILFQF